MRNALRAGLIACTLGLGISALVAPLGGQQAPGYKAPRAADGRPDLNGIWQAVNTANYDIEPHVARPAMALRPGPYGPLPAKPTSAIHATAVATTTRRMDASS